MNGEGLYKLLQGYFFMGGGRVLALPCFNISYIFVVNLIFLSAPLTHTHTHQQQTKANVRDSLFIYYVLYPDCFFFLSIVLYFKNSYLKYFGSCLSTLKREL